MSTFFGSFWIYKRKRSNLQHGDNLASKLLASNMSLHVLLTLLKIRTLAESRSSGLSRYNAGPPVPYVVPACRIVPPLIVSSEQNDI